MSALLLLYPHYIVAKASYAMPSCLLDAGTPIRPARNPCIMSAANSICGRLWEWDTHNQLLETISGHSGHTLATYMSNHGPLSTGNPNGLPIQAVSIPSHDKMGLLPSKVP